MDYGFKKFIFIFPGKIEQGMQNWTWRALSLWVLTESLQTSFAKGPREALIAHFWSLMISSYTLILSQNIPLKNKNQFHIQNHTSFSSRWSRNGISLLSFVYLIGNEWGNEKYIQWVRSLEFNKTEFPKSLNS